MRSRARFFGGLPLHALLVPFPLAFCTGACAFDLVGVQLGLAGWYTAAKYLLGTGIVGALVAAVPGLVDFFWTVLPGSHARRRAHRHMWVALAALPPAALAFWIRGAPGVPPDPPIVALEVVVAVLLLIAAFLGWLLVFRDRIGVVEGEER